MRKSSRNPNTHRSPTKQGSGGGPPTPKNKVFLGGIPFNVQEHELLSYFSKFGEVVQLTLPFCKRRKRLKGFAFVEFSSRQSYKKVLLQKHHFLKGRFMTARPALDKTLAKINSEQIQRQKIFAKGFPQGTTEVEIFNFFSQYGQVNRILIGLDQHPRLDRPKFRGFAFVVMDSKEDFDTIISMKDLRYKGSVIRVSRSRTQEELLQLPSDQNFAGIQGGAFGGEPPNQVHRQGLRGDSRQQRREEGPRGYQSEGYRGSEFGYGDYEFSSEIEEEDEGKLFFDEIIRSEDILQHQLPQEDWLRDSRQGSARDYQNDEIFTQSRTRAEGGGRHLGRTDSRQREGMLRRPGPSPEDRLDLGGGGYSSISDHNRDPQRVTHQHVDEYYLSYADFAHQQSPTHTLE